MADTPRRAAGAKTVASKTAAAKTGAKAAAKTSAKTSATGTARPAAKSPRRQATPASAPAQPASTARAQTAPAGADPTLNPVETATRFWQDLGQTFTENLQKIAPGMKLPDASSLGGSLMAGVPGLPGLPDLSQLPGLGALGAAAKPGAAGAFAQVPQSIESLTQGLGQTLKSIVGLSVSPEVLAGIQQEYMQQAASLWNKTLEGKAAELKPADRRFAAPAWTENPGTAFMASMYLLNANTLKKLADSLQGDDKARERVRFAVQQWSDAASPANFLALNPEAQKKALETHGESLAQGLKHLLNDVKQGHLSMTDESLFEVGRNMATTEGSVVFENPLFQLIEYKPVTEQVREVPFLLVPPCINKYYILDLQPDNSFVRYALSQGQRVFIVSWVNADESLSKVTWDDYIEQGVIQAIRTVQDITGAPRINALGFCIGGTLLATALAVLAARGEKPVTAVTFLTAFLDFSNTGAIDVFVSEELTRMREMSIGPDSPTGGGLIKGSELATTFSFLRPNDLVWNYVVGNYLKGETPPPFDLLYWNSDSTNLPGPMYCWYLRNTYLENNLKVPGKTSVNGTPVDFGQIDIPAFIYASREDHIVPWTGAYETTKLIRGDNTFVLGASGHIAGVINPPEKKKRNFWIGKTSGKNLPAQAQDWFDQAQEVPGSWWPVWGEWLAARSGGWKPAPKAPGNKAHPVIEPAPGRYVKRRA